MANNLPSLFGSFLGLFRRTERRPAPRRWPERRFKPGIECCEERVVPVVTGITPVVVSDSVPTGNYGVGAVVAITVDFNEAVTVTSGGAPTAGIPVFLTLGGTQKAVYNATASTPSAGTLVFDYTVVSGQFQASPLSIGSSIMLSNGSTITDAATGTANANRNLVTTSFAGVNVDGVKPAVQSLTYNGDFSSGTGLLSFDLVVKIPNVATLSLTTADFEALTVASTGTPPSPIGSGLNSATTVQSVSLVSSVPGTSPQEFLTYKITVKAGNGIGRVGLFLVDNAASPTIVDSFGNSLSGLTPITSTSFSPTTYSLFTTYGAETALFEATSFASVAHNYHII